MSPFKRNQNVRKCLHAISAVDIFKTVRYAAHARSKTHLTPYMLLRKNVLFIILNKPAHFSSIDIELVVKGFNLL